MDDRCISSNVAAIELALEIRSRVNRGLDLDTDRLLERFRVASENIGVLPASGRDALIVERFGLSAVETMALWTLIALRLSDKAIALAHSLGATKTGAVTEAVLSSLVALDPIATFNVLSSTAALRRCLLIEPCDNGGPDQHESRWTWVVSRRVLAFLCGDGSIDPDVASIARIPADVTPIDQLAANEQVVASVRDAVKGGTVTVCVAGASGLGRRTLLAAAAGEAGLDIIEVDARKLAKDPSRLKKQLKMLARECMLLARVPLIANVDACADAEAIGTELVREIDGVVLVTCGMQRPSLRWGRPVIAVEMAAPSSTQRVALWQRALGQGTLEDAEFLATQYPLAPAVIHHAAHAALARSNGRQLVPDDIYAGIKTVLDDRLGEFARRVTVTQTWDDIVLPEDQVAQVAGMLARIRQRRRVYEQWGFAAKVGRGLGTTALFSGPPGTGKTMVAGLIAKDLGLELYQVDMAKLVSKYIGETEKQLAAMFDAAEAGHAILLFDEADSLFGKRTDVRSSNDRYANLETNYLLQRLESFTGICILTSNHEANIDPAFQRRLSLHVRFELPDIAEREKLWRAMLPVAAPVAADVDFAGLARRFAMSGGYIRNAALRAAFLAADEDGAISHAHLEYAARLEYEAMGKIAVAA